MMGRGAVTGSSIQYLFDFNKMQYFKIIFLAPLAKMVDFVTGMLT